MLRKFLLVTVFIVMVTWLSGCQKHLEDLLGIVNELLSSDSDTEEVVDSAQEKEGEEADEADRDKAAEDEADSEEAAAGEEDDEASVPMQVFQPYADFTLITLAEKPIDDRLKEQGYTLYRDPDGMPLPIPYYWILVENEADQNNFSGLYCFDIPQDIQVLANHFDHYFLEHSVEHDSNPANDSLIHVTTLDIDQDGDRWQASILYGIDEHENTCAQVEINYENAPSIFIESAEEIKPLDDSRERKLPNHYEETLQQATSESNFYFHPSSNSVQEAIYEEEVDMLPILAREVPSILLYDSYLTRSIPLDVESGWGGLMCTDVPISVAVDKHLEMLGNYNANIEHFEVVDPADNTSMLRAAVIVDFSFNDEYGTGSWSGSSYFYRYEEDEAPFSEQKCMATEMTFSTVLVK